MTTHRPRKRFGQNFLHDAHIIDAIIKAIAPSPTDNILEIGPGLGALTKPLLTHVNHLNAIEIDDDLYAKLQHLSDQLTVTHADALTVDLTPFGKHLRVVGNLPYNISTPLLFHLLNYATQIKDMHFMLQKEVVQRLSAHPHTKAYGRLSVMTQAQCDVSALFLVPPGAFTPPPKVDSAVVRLIPHSVQPDKATLKALEVLLLQAFSTRRKTLKNTLKNLLTPDAFTQLNVNPADRAETLPVKKYLEIAKYLTKTCKME